MAAAATLRVIEELNTWLVELPAAREDMREDMESLRFELESVLDFVRDKKPGERSRLSYFICDLVEIVQDVLDVDKYRYSYTFLMEINSVQTRLVLAKKRALQLGLRALEMSGPAVAVKVGEGDEEGAVGLDEQVGLLLGKAIFSEKQDLSTSFITGMTGIGKTTLARELYNHADVNCRFERRAWVCASNELSNKEVLLKLMEQVVDCERDSPLEKMECADNESLQQMIHRNLQGISYFIVLDDLPKQLRLMSIMKALPLEGEHNFPKNLEKKGKEMLKICSGLPLAVKFVGRQLARKKQSGTEWEQLLDEPIDLSAILEALELFYHKLDSEVKSCFLHLAYFKENTTLRHAKLIHIWGAGGILPESEIRSYIRNLVSESIIDEVKEMKGFRMNAILHRLSMKKAEEEIGFEVLSNHENHRPSQSPSHRVIKCSREELNYPTDQNKHLVSLYFHGGGYFDSSLSYWKSFEVLWILDLEDFGLKVLPKSIGKLVELRYLGLRNNHLQKLPHTLRCLKKLEVLDIALNLTVEVPDIISHMSSLRHLYMSDVICREPLKIDALPNLETLTYISVDNWTYGLSGLKMMAALRKLGIVELDRNSEVGKLFASLAKLGFLQHLILRGFRFRSMPCLDDLGILHGLTVLKLDGLLVKLPSADNFPPFIYELGLVNSYLDEDPMPVLEQLPHLIHLKLRNAYAGQRMVILRDGFSRLEVLCIEELWNLRDIRVAKGAMWHLKILEINNCPFLETLPEEIASKTKLEKVKMVTTKNIATKIRKSALISKIRGGVDIKP